MQTLKQAVEGKGGITAAASILGVTPQRLANWVDRGVPTELCAKVETLLGADRRLLRPDDWQAIWPELIEAKAGA
jgi:DNA-binding transcriptional regulator YdaS (Cro superfamily)